MHRLIEHRHDRDPTPRWRWIGWSLAAGLLLLPWLAMQFTSEVTWTAGDFVFAAVLLGGTGLGLELAARAGGGSLYVAAAAVALASALLMTWINAAVGLVGTDGDPANRMFADIVLLGIAGAIIAGREPQRLARAMGVLAACQAIATVAAGFMDMRGFVLSACFTGAWGLSARLFHRAAQAPANVH